MHHLNPFLFAGGGGATDPNFAQVAGLWHFDETAGALTFADFSVNNNSITSDGATCVTSAGQVKFGAHSVYRTSTSSALVKANNIAAYAIGTSDYTIEFWVRIANLVSTRYIFSMAPTIGSAGATANIFTWGDGKITFRHNAIDETSAAGVLVNTTWHAIAVDRAGTSGRMYVDGAVVKSFTDSTDYNTGTAVVQIGASSTYVQDTYWDEMRITNGVARYQGAYTPATAAFPDA